MQPINIIMIYCWDKKLKKELHVLEADIIIKKERSIDLMSLAERMHFLQVLLQMTTFALVSVINHYHINGLHLFWDTMYNKNMKEILRIVTFNVGQSGVEAFLKSLVFLFSSNNERAWILSVFAKNWSVYFVLLC